MTSFTDDIFTQLSGPALQQISQQLGTGQTQTAGAVAAALPLLIGALGRNASQPQGAEALFGALGRDFSGAGGGGLGDILGAVLGGTQSRQTDGLGQLGHIFGGRQQQAVSGLGQATGLGSDKAQMLLKILAPIVMAYLAKQVFGGGQAQAGAAPSAGALGEILGQQGRQVQQQGGLGGGLLGAVLDQDGDGDLDFNDILKAGMGMMGGRR